ncbi:MAG TPA: polymer-forming cytoskeletal protein [Archangium sp.]|jgi:cytoskeletal protein CcmA (bactofilin family)
MALFDKSSKNEESAVSPRTGGGEVDTLLGKGSEFEGKLVFKGQVRIDGKYSGHIQTDEVLIVGPSAKVNAEISAGTVVISGSVEGLIRASSVVELHKGAKVKGTIESPQITMERDVTFDGTMKMDSLSGASKGAPPPPGAK